VNERDGARRSVCDRTELATNLLGEEIFVLAWIFLASRIIFRILHDANSLQVRAG
jgi:uncharacterized MAPEG superfamily protein